MTAAAPDSLEVTPGAKLAGTVPVPGDKSVSHRVLMLGALASGETRASNFLPSLDCDATRRALEALGVRIEALEDNVRVRGVGLHGLRAPASILDVGNSGTSMRLLAGILAGQPFASTLDGDASLRRRPMDRIADPLSRMGAGIVLDGGRPPVAITGRRPLAAIDYRLPVASAQVKSAVLLAGLYADGPVHVTGPAPTRDHTERMLAAFGADIETGEGRVTLRPGRELTGGSLRVPGDLSSAAFFMVAAAICPGAFVQLPAVGINPTRRGVIDILRRMGADVRLDDRRESAGEPTADIRVHGSDLSGVTIDAGDVALAIDEIPVLMVAAACASGRTVVEGAGELRVKESDRLRTMAEGLTRLGIRVREWSDGVEIEGGALGSGDVDAAGDHRVAMSFVVAGSRAAGPVRVHGCRNIPTSFPGFLSAARRVGMELYDSDELPHIGGRQT